MATNRPTNKQDAVQYTPDVATLPPATSVPAAADTVADPVADAIVANVRPGGLRSDTTMLVQTYQAQRLVYGRRAKDGVPAIIGLVRFGMLLKRIWGSAASDDPYADWFLIQILDAIESARSTILQFQQETTALVNARTGVEISIAHSQQPVRIPLSFASPFGYMGAYLIADFDELVRALVTTRHVGLMSRDRSEQIINTGARPIRHAFALATRWKYTGLTREDVKQDTQPARAAATAMGQLPADVLAATRRASVSPVIRDHDGTNMNISWSALSPDRRPSADAVAR
jgi:integrating conjugative element protein (TIGR03761 family)